MRRTPASLIASPRRAARFGWLSNGLWLLLTAIAMALVLFLQQEPAPGTIKTTNWGLASFPVVQFQRYTSPFGMRWHPIRQQWRMHRGLDIAAPEGSELRNWWAGTVTEVGFDPKGYGNYIAVVSGQWEHLYAHCKTIAVKQGQRVKTRQLLGTIGKTGGATGPHLHWELRFKQNGKWQLINPASILKKMHVAHTRAGYQPVAAMSEVDRNSAQEVWETY